MGVSKKQIHVTAALLARATTNLSELGVDYVVIVKGIDTLISNVENRYAMAIAEDAIELQRKLHEYELEIRADNQAERKSWGDVGGDEKV
jgi:hypothetical protein